MRAVDTEVSDLVELARVMEMYFRLSFPDPLVRDRWVRPLHDFCGDAPQRFYRIIPTNIYLPDLDSTKTDRRLEVDLSLIKQTVFSYERFKE